MGTDACQYRNVSPSSIPCTNTMTESSRRLVEMFVGIVCACMPSAAQTCRHHLPHYRSLKTRVYFQLHALRSGIRRIQNPDDYSNSGGHPETTSTAGPYPDLQSYKLAKHSDLTQTKGIRTFIHGGLRGDIESDGIHLTYDMSTNSQYGCADTVV